MKKKNKALGRRLVRGRASEQAGPGRAQQHAGGARLPAGEGRACAGPDPGRFGAAAAEFGGASAPRWQFWEVQRQVAVGTAAWGRCGGRVGPQMAQHFRSTRFHCVCVRGGDRELGMTPRSSQDGGSHTTTCRRGSVLGILRQEDRWQEWRQDPAAPGFPGSRNKVVKVQPQRRGSSRPVQLSQPHPHPRLGQEGCWLTLGLNLRGPAASPSVPRRSQLPRKQRAQDTRRVSWPPEATRKGLMCRGHEKQP